MGTPDTLSRRADHGSGQGDNDNMTLLAPELFKIHALAGARFQGDEQNILQEVWHSLKGGVQEESIAKAAKELWKEKSRGTVKGTECSESEGLLMFCGKIYVLNDRDLQHPIIEQHHDTRIARHAGHFKTLCHTLIKCVSRCARSVLNQAVSSCSGKLNYINYINHLFRDITKC
jgi:hypothetical protein